MIISVNSNSELRDVIHERITKHHNNLEAHPNPLLELLLQPINTKNKKVKQSLYRPGVAQRVPGS
jgi:hypothetical protein